jgi:hypothetical protein
MRWSKPQTWPMTVRVLALMFGAVYLPLGYALYGWGSAASPATYINHYETPCQTEARNVYGVPLRNDDLVQWQLDHLNTAEGLAYNRTSLACPQPAKWDFDNMVLVGKE